MRKYRLVAPIGSICLFFAVGKCQASDLTPIPDIECTYQFTCVGDDAQFDGSASYDQDELGDPPQIAHYYWWYGDDLTWHDDGATPTHIYDSAGTYTVWLYVEDNEGTESLEEDDDYCCCVQVIDVTIQDVPPNRDTDEYFPHQSPTPADIYYKIEPTEGWTPTSVKLFIKDGDTNIRTINLPSQVGEQSTTWDGKKDNGQWADPKQYTMLIWVDAPGTFCSHAHAMTVFKVDIDTPASFPTYIGIDTELDLGSTVTPSSAKSVGTFGWSKVTGPGSGTVTFSPSDSSEDPSFSADQPGEYTVKVDFTVGGVTDSDTSGIIEVRNAKMIFKVGGSEASSITRAETGSFEVVDKDGNAIDGATYSNWKFNGVVDVTSSHTTRTWSGQIVQWGGASCYATFGGKTCKVAKWITVNSRSGWSITPHCTQDAEPGWVYEDDPHGGFPSHLPWKAGNYRNSDDQDYLIKPRGPHWEDGYTTAKVAAGPNKDVWYIASCSFVINMETVINKYLKSGTTPPNPPGDNFHEYNEGEGVDADKFLQRAKNHEYEGTDGNGHGHHVYLEVEEAKPNRDAKQRIESKVGPSESVLKVVTGLAVYNIEQALWDAGGQEPPDGSNWSGTIWVFDFDALPQKWIDINTEF